MRLSAIDRKILNCIQEEIPLNSRPFRILSKKIGIEEGQLLQRIKQLKTQGVIRNFSCRLNHKKLKFKSTLIALKVPLNRVRAFAKEVSNYPAVTHCYLRKGEYNLWYVLVYKDGRTNKFLKKMEKKIGKENILNLPTQRQFKLKTKLMI